MDLFIVTLAGILAGFSAMFGFFSAQRWGLAGGAESVIGWLFVLPFLLVISLVPTEGSWLPVIGVIVSAVATWIIVLKSGYHRGAGRNRERLGLLIQVGGILVLIAVWVTAERMVLSVFLAVTLLFLVVIQTQIPVRVRRRVKKTPKDEVEEGR